jgi:RNA-binding protein 5/10
VNASTNTNVGQRPPQPVASSSKAQSPSSPVASDGYDYSDVQASGKVACLLCQRALPSAEVMRKHVLTSELHKTNLANPSVVEAGKKRKQASLAKLSTTPDLTGNGEDQPKYRDRAAERREVFNQPEKPHYMDRVALSIPSGPPKRKFAEGPKEPSPPPEPGLAPGVDESNKGNTLLTKMGWAAGTGLGKGKEGRVEPIEVKLLGERAGLGAKR